MQSFRGRPFLLEQLMRPVNTGRIVHAQIFYGPAGSGRTTAALTIAKALNCTASGKRPCGLCPSCRRFAEGCAPELLRITPEDSTSIKIEPIRDLIEKISIAADGGTRCIILKPADAMTVAAQNALLKTLEEAPEDAVFFLITDNLSALLPTIRSRCALTRFAPLPERDVEEVLLERDPLLDREKARLASKASCGLIGKAMEILNDPSYDGMIGDLGAALEGLKKKDGVSQGAMVLLKYKDEASKLLAALETACEEVLNGSADSPVARKIKSANLAPLACLEAVMHCRMLLERNTSWQYALDILLYEIVTPEEN